jgi:hypothetical protein
LLSDQLIVSSSCATIMEGNYEKTPPKGGDIHTSTQLTNTVAVGEKNGTQHDEMDMDRMGKLQQLRVRSCTTHGNTLRH